MKKEVKNVKKDNPLVSIVIPVYNGENYVNEAIDSAINQTYKNIEIIVVDDGSKDKTEEICKSYGDKIRYFKKENGGVASALNFGIKKMKGEYFSWLSHDDLYKKNKIETEINILNKLQNKETIIFSNFELIDKFGKKFSQTNYTSFYSKEELCKNIFPVIKGIVNGDTILINKKCFENVGIFREDLHCTQDYDLWFKLFDYYPSYLVEECLVQYRIHDKQDTNNYPNVNGEGDLLWKKTIDSLTINKIESWGQNPIEILFNLHYQMKCAGYKLAEETTWNYIKNVYFNYNPKVSIIMPCYNEEKYIKKSINSILEQSYGGFELIVVDDNSTDKTYEIVEKMARDDFRIKLYKNEFAKGIVGGLNTALKHAKGEYITRQDADDISIFTRLESQVSIFQKNQNVGYVATNINFMDESDKVYQNNLYCNPIAPLEFELAFGNPIPNATIMYNKKFIDKYDLKFNGNLNVAEDYYFLLNYVMRTKSKGFFISDGLYNYRIHKNSEFHKNVNLAISKSIEYSKKYYNNFAINSSEIFEEVSFAEANLIIENNKLSNVIELYINLLIGLMKVFNFTDDDIKGVSNYISSKINLGYLSQKKEVVNVANSNNYNKKKNSRFRTLVSKAKHYYGINGLKKTITKVIKYPFKFLKRK